MLKFTRYPFMIAAALAAMAPIASHADYTQTNLVSDQAGVAAHQDANLVNAWGISAAPGGPFWVSDNGTGFSTLYNTSGTPQSLVVTIPTPSSITTPAAVTGQVFNTFRTTDFGQNIFLFATEDGTISGWKPATSATLAVDNSSAGAVYKGLALGSTSGSNYLYAANFNAGKIDVFDKNFASATLTGNFSDSSLTSNGYAPFNVQNINGELYVTYALQNGAKHDDIAGIGNGAIDVFNTDGTLNRRLATGSGTSLTGTASELDSPWGLTLAPANFGEFSNDLLVGNFGDGHISAFNPNTDAYLGQLKNADGSAVAIDGLWGLINGNGGSGGDANKVYFSAGPNGETHGLFGSLQVTPEPGANAALLVGCLSFGGLLLRRRFRKNA